MARPSPIELEFGRTFTLVILLVVVPSAGLSGFGILAIINERAAVEKKLESAWGTRLDVLGQSLETAVLSARMITADGKTRIQTLSGEVLSDASFALRENRLSADDPEFQRVLQPHLAQLEKVGERPDFFVGSGG